MLNTIHVSEKTVNLNYSNSNTGGTFIQYFKLYFQLLKMTTQLKELSAGQKFKSYSLIILKTPWWLLIKPIGMFFTIKTVYQGNFYCQFRNNKLSKTQFSNFNKTCNLFLFKKIPILYWKTSSLSQKDQKILIEKYAF